jgi:hypothetical protein
MISNKVKAALFGAAFTLSYGLAGQYGWTQRKRAVSFETTL